MKEEIPQDKIYRRQDNGIVVLPRKSGSEITYLVYRATGEVDPAQGFEFEFSHETVKDYRPIYWDESPSLRKEL